MDIRKFDDLTRSMASGKSRRTVIKGLFGGVVGGIAIAGRPAYGALAGIAETECTIDDDCDVGMCCAGVCRDIECCIDNPDPNATCPEGTSCFEGQCDPIQLGCGSDDQCAGDEICCEGVCAAIQCCIGDADPNARCPEGTSCFEGQCDAAQEVFRDRTDLPRFEGGRGGDPSEGSRQFRVGPAGPAEEEMAGPASGGAVNDPEPHAILPAKRARSFRRAR